MVRMMYNFYSSFLHSRFSVHFLSIPRLSPICTTLARLVSHTCIPFLGHLHGSRATLVLLDDPSEGGCGQGRGDKKQAGVPVGKIPCAGTPACVSGWRKYQ